MNLRAAYGKGTYTASGKPRKEQLKVNYILTLNQVNFRDTSPAQCRIIRRTYRVNSPRYPLVLRTPTITYGRLRGLAVACWTTDHYHPCSNRGVGISEGRFVFHFVSLPLEVARPVQPTLCTKVALKRQSSSSSSSSSITYNNIHNATIKLIITTDQVLQCIKRLKRNSSPGIGDICGEFLINGTSDALSSNLSHFYSCILSFGLCSCGF